MNSDHETTEAVCVAASVEVTSDYMLDVCRVTNGKQLLNSSEVGQKHEMSLLS
jgi:hypothetical protein